MTTDMTANIATDNYQALTTETLPERLGSITAIAQSLGGPPDTWQTREVGDGNLNLVFIVTGSENSIIVKQALPYVRLIGESWPLALKRNFFEYHALVRQHRYDPGSVPEIYYFTEKQALIAMEYLTPHVILRHSFMQGIMHDNLAKTIGQFAARTAFRGSDLALESATRKADLALFAGNDELFEITENLVFTEPYFAAEQNHHTTPELDNLVARLRQDTELLVESQHLKAAFCSNAETLMHGDLHAGSIMVHAGEVKFIDPEFAAYGPMGFDIGMCMGNLFMAYFAQTGHENAASERDDYRQWILEVCTDTWDSFEQEFRALWRSERRGSLYNEVVLEQQGQPTAAEQALNQRLIAIWQDQLGFAGVEIHRRILGLAHIIELDAIENTQLRAACEARAIKLGRYLIVNRRNLSSMHSVIDMAKLLQNETPQDIDL